MKVTEVIIIGGGLAGLTAAIHLSKVGIEVTLIEKNSFPKHKVCGEYISNEVLPYLEWLGIDIQKLGSVPIAELEFSTSKGKTISSTLPLGGFGISRYTFDEFLFKKAIQNGCTVIKDTVESIVFEDELFTIVTVNDLVLKSKIAIGAFGKRSAIDQQLNRLFINNKSPWLAAKAHYSGNFPDGLVGLHNFKGGYCGVSKVENDAINICYLADYTTFKKYKNTHDYQEAVLSQNPKLKAIFEESTLIFDKPITISQISFAPKKTVENHILMIGDTAGLIHPLCGNGMAMAIHSAKIASELIQKFLTTTHKDRKKLERDYIKEWNYNFKNRLKTGRFLAAVLQKECLSAILIQILYLFPFLLSSIIKRTHGKPIILNG
jgi:hypothetical protein